MGSQVDRVILQAIMFAKYFKIFLGILVLIRAYFFFGCASSTVPFGRQTIHVHSQVVLAKTKYLRDSEFQDIYRFQSKLAAI